MTLRIKIGFFIVAFLAVSVTLGVKTFIIFEQLSDSIETLLDELRNDSAFGLLNNDLIAYVSLTRDWAARYDPGVKLSHTERAANIERQFRRIEDLVGPADFARFEAEYRRLQGLSEGILGTTRDGNKTELMGTLERFRMQEPRVFLGMHEMHERWITATLEEFEVGEARREDLKLNMFMIIAGCLTLSALLVILLKRVLGEPYREILEATERVAAGDMTFRIDSDRRDEYGIIAERFDLMVANLERSKQELTRKLEETELYLQIARTSGGPPDLSRTLGEMARTVGDKLHSHAVLILLYDSARHVYVVKATYGDVGATANLTLPLAGRVMTRLMVGSRPEFFLGIQNDPELAPLAPTARGMLIAPILRETGCAGVLCLGRQDIWAPNQGEQDTVEVIALTIGNAIRNIELYESASKQLQQVRALFELSKSLTTVFVPDQIFKTITSEVTRLINARGCVIRLIEGDMLRAVSWSGEIDDLGEDAAVPIGTGVAGRVALTGKPLLVRDINDAEADIKDSILAEKSAIAVPLMRDDSILGTLGLYDKRGPGGELIPFSEDDLAVASGFASISALAIDKTHMIESVLESEARARHAKNRMDMLFESVQGGIITLDRNYRITSANKYVQKWCDHSIKEIEYRSAEDVFHGKGGICPHCVARPTFERGDINSITQASGLNYAELTAYPVTGEQGSIEEVAVFIQDITERVLYQEEIMGLYREVMQTKEFNESLIGNSADAIVTTDLDGRVTSWNPAAENIYGYKSAEVMDRFMPFIPDSLLGFERDNIGRIKHGEVLKLETFRRHKDGATIEVELTLSPIKDISGEIIGISGISRDITDKKRVQKELIRRNQELSRLFFISSAMRGTLELDRLLQMVLTAVTMSDGLGFNRAILFLLDEEGKALRGGMGVGPSTPEEAWHVWEGLSQSRKSLKEILEEMIHAPLRRESTLDDISLSLAIPLTENAALPLSVREKKSYNILDATRSAIVDRVLVEQLGTTAYAVVPMVSMDKAIGVLWVDNQFNKKPITIEDMKFLEGFTDQVASAIEAARLFQKVSLAEAELENIFRSISDMVYITDSNYTIKNVNQAVERRVGMSRAEIVGNKCYRVFHGKDRPWAQCPHHKTVKSLTAHIEEVEDPYLKGTFLTSTSPVFDTEGGFLGTVHVVREISELKELRERLQSSERKAALGEVAAKVAHEIRNPLVSIGGFAKRLQTNLEGRDQEYAKIIADEVRRLEIILKDILGFVKEIRLERRDVDLNTLAGEVLSFFAEEIKARGNVARTNLLPGGVSVYVDQDRVREALVNIISNANQAAEGGIITVSTRVETGYAVIEVTDTGTGIRPEDRVRIFDPFYTTKHTGTGLGLAISKRIVEEHDGRLTIADDKGPGEGATFIINLPLIKEDLDEDNDRG